MQYGDLQIHALPEGLFTVGLDKRFVPHAEGAALPTGTLFVSVCPFLVQTPSEVLLLDAGLGSWAEGRGVEPLLEGLTRHGVAREAVTRVVLSHLHLDHAGGAVYAVQGEWRPTFPNADYVVQREERMAEGYNGPSVEARDRVLDTLDGAGQLVLVDGDARVTDAVAVEKTNGHTGAHQLVRLDAGGGRTAVYAGDVLAGPSQVTRRFQAKYDVDGAASQRWRDRLVAEAAAEGHLLLFFHGTDAYGGFVEEGPKGGYRVEPAAL
ncbi:MAG: MBL fold metallo-hydrolase [Rubricoccaceae bacterium]|nr:MBL fold metallo-hydrolase [Rubricoccaceae bacterium]